MAYKINYKSSVAKDLKRIDKSEVKRILDGIEKNLKKDPYSAKALSGDFKGLYRYRLGKYRVIFTIIGDEVLILKIGHRKGVYRKVK